MKGFTDQRGLIFLAFHNFLFDIIVDHTIFGGNETTGHHNPLRSQRERCRKGLAVGDAAHRHHGDFHGFDNTGGQHHGCDIIIQRMSALLDAGGVNAVIAGLLRVQGMTHRPHLMKKFNPCFFQQVDVLGTHRLVHRSAGHFNARHFFFRANPQVHLVMPRRDAHGRKNGDSDHERLVGKFTGLTDSVAEVLFRFIISRGKISHPPRVGNRRGERRFTKPHHRPTNNGVLDPKHLGDCRLHLNPPL